MNQPKIAIRRLRQKEKKYFSRLRGKQFSIYREHRNPKHSIKKNKIRIKKYLKKSNKIYKYNIEFPKKFNIYNQYDTRGTIKICNLLIGKEKYLFLNLSKVEILSAAACALLLSSLLKAISMGKKIYCNYSDNEKANAVLQKIGFFDLLNRKKPLSVSSVNSYEDIRCWYVYQGEGFETKVITDCVHEFTSKHLSLDNKKEIISEELKKKIEINIKELIGNTVEHAYPLDYKFDRKWILFAQYSISRNQFIIVISDSGKTIPVTFVQYHKNDTDFDEKMRSFLTKDTKLIEMAVQESKSGTKKSGRGNGLKRVQESVNKHGGALVIYSKYGCYKDIGTTAYIDEIKLSEKIQGTIVDIMLPLEYFE